MFKEVNPESLSDNFFKAVGKEWMLITAGNKEKHNMMTASWGYFGVMWARPSAVIAVRPQRFTREFLDNEDYFTLSFYGDDRKDIHAVCGNLSGRDINKTEKCGLTVLYDSESGAPYFNEARLVFVCRKKYRGKLTEDNFFGGDVLKGYYPNNDLHYMYIGEIEKVLVKE